MGDTDCHNIFLFCLGACVACHPEVEHVWWQYDTELGELNRQMKGLEEAMSSIEVTDSEKKKLLELRKKEIEKQKREAEEKKAAAAAAEKKAAENKIRMEAQLAEAEKLKKEGRVAPPSSVPPPPGSKGKGKGKGKASGPLAAGGKAMGKGGKAMGKGKGKGGGGGGGARGRYHLTELHDTAGTIWADAADGEGTSGLLDAHVGAGLMSMFQKKAKQATEKKVKVEKSKKGQVTVLIDSKRALKGGILLAAFKDYDLVKRSLFVGDSDFLTLQRVEALMEIVPSENELAKIDSYSLEEGERLAECERYFMSVRSVPRIERRCHEGMLCRGARILWGAGLLAQLCSG